MHINHHSISVCLVLMMCWSVLGREQALEGFSGLVYASQGFRSGEGTRMKAALNEQDQLV